METPNTIFNPSSIVDILTLRYDTSIQPNLPKKSWEDFVPIDKPPSITSIETSICDEIESNLQSHNFKDVSIALSGGVDSTLVLSLLRKTNPDLKINAISIKFANSVDETPTAAKIAERFEAEHNIIQLENYLSELPKAISIIKLPFWDLHWYYVVKKSKTLSKTIISGDGGDELFAGYTFRYKKFLSLTSENSTPLEKVKAYLQCHERDRVADQENIFNQKCGFSWNSLYSSLLSFFDNSLARLDQVYLADYNGKLLYNFNPINSRIVNHFEMNQLAPILNNELIANAPHIPSNYKYDSEHGIGKLPLRAILEQNNSMSLVSKEKLGFNVNTLNLWKSVGQSLCQEYLIDSEIAKDGWINKDWIDKYIHKAGLDVSYVNKFLGLLAFEIWYRLFVTKDMSANTTLN
ncbi:MAG: asparagine synthase C-terminal domain-containing protein [Nitrosopumilus sp.]|nr:asparagine synthase C-terminal domain-containing protein [Nitrosopumilus sp.]